ncbi:hypothetical protein KSS87_010718 [Heliosperma pusillum]|nr:hypothetical protein KSS87_022897 [Heliosperma pusillum]KAH9617842.1 hypothetical protein KSS87_010718 [Heliosperma pusillum]
MILPSKFQLHFLKHIQGNTKHKYTKLSKLTYKMSNLPLKILLPLFTLLISSLPILVISQVPTSDHQILLNIKEQWNNQAPMQSWNSSTSYCQWPGVFCTDDDEAVTGISLGSLSLNGEIPSSICELKNLTSLDVGDNNIKGNFPTFLYNCTKLQILNLSQNYFQGLLPNDLHKLSPNLKHIDLSGNNFSGDIPSSIAQLKELVTLHLDQNFLNGAFPSELGTLENLQELVLANNPFLPMSLPKEFGNLNKLKVLLMKECNLVGEIPTSFNNLSSIERLDLVKNKLVGEIPDGLLLLNNLSYLYLYENNLTGGLPSSIEALNLVELDVSMNNLSGPMPEEITKLEKLEILALFQNNFNGTLPTSIGLMPSMKNLKLFNNNFHGPLPQDIGLHSKLEGFEVPNNGFTGPLPEHLCAGGALVGVVAFNNHLNGTIPTSLGRCNSLLTVELHDNNLTGEVPQGVWTLMNISTIQLSNNQLSGQLPGMLAWNMTRVEIDHNRFSGKIPQSVRNWGGLVVFQASNNMISGSIPLELTSLSQLNSLQLGGNQLSGELPSEILAWKNLNSLNLSNNLLSGLIPLALGSLPVLNYLDLSSNQLSGQIPPELGQLKLTSLNLSSNKLSGTIPFGLDNKAYEDSFLSTNLCSNLGVSNLSKCSIFRQKTKTLSSKYLALVLVLAFVSFLVTTYFTMFLVGEFRRRKNNRDLETWKLTSFHKLNFTEEKVLANLNETNMIGSGGSGQVYRIPINRSEESVAVKRIWNNRKMNNTLEKEFLAEVEILGTIRHFNIVKLLCCISSESSKLLVYEYMENMSLDQWIHESRRQPVSEIAGADQRVVLDWPARLRIAIGAAQGLSYMHHDCSPPIIHRDVKSSNILLDSEFNAKIADFGLAKILVKPGGEPHTVSAVAGSFGYMAPEYSYTNKVNEKIDVYSFGVVLLELVTGKEPQIGDEYSNLAEWAWKHYSQGHPITDIINNEIKDATYLEEMTNVFKIGLMCTSTLPSSRPTMKEVLQVLKKCNALEGSGRAKARNDRDASPLLGSGFYVSSCKNSKKGTEEDDYGMV